VLVRRAGPGDRRVTVLELTTAGERLPAEMLRHMTGSRSRSRRGLPTNGARSWGCWSSWLEKTDAVYLDGVRSASVTSSSSTRSRRT
jgi:hypothetical protein